MKHLSFAAKTALATLELLVITSLYSAGIIYGMVWSMQRWM